MELLAVLAFTVLGIIVFILGYIFGVVSERRR